MMDQPSPIITEMKPIQIQRRICEMPDVHNTCPKKLIDLDVLGGVGGGDAIMESLDRLSVLQLYVDLPGTCNLNL